MSNAVSRKEKYSQTQSLWYEGCVFALLFVLSFSHVKENMSGSVLG